MPRQKQKTSAPRSKLVDSMYLLGAALAVVAIIGAIIAFFIVYDAASWMPHGDRAMQIFGAVLGFGFGVAYLYNAWQSRRLQRALADKPYLQPLAALLGRWWISLAISLVGFAVAVYSLAVFLGVTTVVRAATVPSLVQVLAGTVLVLGGLTALAVTFKVHRHAKLTASVVALGFVLPAVLVISGIVRLVVGYRQLVR